MILCVRYPFSKWPPVIAKLLRLTVSSTNKYALLSAQAVLTAASAAEASMKTAGVAMNRATAELEAATSTETGTFMPAEPKKGGRKAKTKMYEVTFGRHTVYLARTDKTPISGAL